MKITRNIDSRMMGAIEYIVHKLEPSKYEYPKQNKRQWNDHRCIEVCRSIDENICLGIITVEITDDGHIKDIIDGRERTAVLYEMYHPEVRTDKRLLMIVGKDEYESNDFVYVDANYSPKQPYEFWVSDVADTFRLAGLLNKKEFGNPDSTHRHIKERLLTFNKSFDTSTVCLQFIQFKQETLGEDIEIQKLRLYGRLNRT